MNTAAPISEPGFLKKSWNGLNSALVVGLILALIGWGFQVRQTRIASTQTYNLERVAELSADGERLDRATVALFNAASEGRPLDEVKAAAKQAVVDHSIKVEAVRSVIGSEFADEYLRALDQLSLEFDRTQGPLNAGRNRTAFGKVIELRRDMVAHAREA